MKIKDMMFMGLRNLFRRKARTSLTVISMAIGTILIMVLASISIGVNNTINKYIMENGEMSIIRISKYSYTVDEEGMYNSQEQIINDRLVEEVKKIKHVRAVSPVIYGNLQLKSGKYVTGIGVYAMDCATFIEFGFPELERGSYPTPENNTIMVFGSESIYDFYDPTSWSYKTKTIDFEKDKISYSIQEWRYQISEKKKQEEYILDNYAKMARSNNWQYNYNVYMDLEYYKELYTKHANTLKLEDRKKALKSLEEYEYIQINVDNMRNVTQVEEEIQKFGFKTESQMQHIQPMIDTADMLRNVLIGIGLVAVLVSAINIANTMIMSIYERTKEIGVMKVLGCLVTDVKKLFLFEAAILGLLGGLIGIALSYLCSYLINKYGTEFLGSLIMSGAVQGTKASVIPWWLPLATGVFSIFVGVVSGYIPARRATKISAIEAMKSEG